MNVKELYIACEVLIEAQYGDLPIELYVGKDLVPLSKLYISKVEGERLVILSEHIEQQGGKINGLG